MASRWSARTSLPFRAYRRLGTIALLLLALVPLHYLWLAARKKSPWPQRFLRWSGRAAGLRVSLAGEPRQHNVLYVANHSSWLDILALAGVTGTAYVAKSDMRSWPVLGWLAKLNETVFVDREAGRRRPQRAADGATAGLDHYVEAVGSALRRGRPLTIFPEGTTGDGRALLPFKSSLLAAVGNITVQPVAIDYRPNATLVGWTDDTSIGENAIPILQRPGRLPVTLHFLEPLAGGDRKALTRQARSAIATAIGQA